MDYAYGLRISRRCWLAFYKSERLSRTRCRSLANTEQILEPHLLCTVMASPSCILSEWYALLPPTRLRSARQSTWRKRTA
eukprot:5278943-Pleurochrysis_carterae.AAC.3